MSDYERVDQSKPMEQMLRLRRSRAPSQRRGLIPNDARLAIESRFEVRIRARADGHRGLDLLPISLAERGRGVVAPDRADHRFNRVDYPERPKAWIVGLT